MIASRTARLGLVALVLTFVYTAWLGDDCYFTLRTVRNFVAGDGLRWNLFERVQAYTHPLWMFVLSAAIGVTGEHYLTTLGVSLVLSVGAAVALVRLAQNASAQALVLALLLLSRAFVDYSTSGLENPLSHLLGVLFLREFLRAERSAASLRRLAGWAGLATVTRLDTLLLYLPALAERTVALLRARPPGEKRGELARAAGALLVGFAPLVLWELFSCFYYGFPFPNTAYAKLGTGIPGSELLVQGFHYLVDCVRRDPPTLVAILVACALSLRPSARGTWPIAAGLLLYLGYVLRIGGDFMSGRFLSLPLVLAAGLLGTRYVEWPARVRAGLVAASFLAGLHLHQLAIVFETSEPRPLGIAPGISARGIDDERFCYYRDMGLLRPGGRFQPEPPLRWTTTDDGLVRMRHGRQAFQAGREAVALELYGLADPLIARLPARFDDAWRIGHFERFAPNGYERTLATGEDHLVDRELARYHARLRLVTAGPLFSVERLRTALALNLGRHDSLIRWNAFRFAMRRRATLAPAGEGLWRNDGGAGFLRIEGTLLEAPRALTLRRITVELAETGVGAVFLVRDGETFRRIAAPSLPPGPGRLELALEGEMATAIWIVPTRDSRARIEGVTVAVD